jgi:hypothetical protein
VPNKVVWRERAERWGPPALVVAALSVVLVPIALSALDGAGRNWWPAGDWAVLELNTRDVGSSITPLIGPYSRFGWNHPGPLLFWVLAVPYRLLGAQSTALFVGTALVNGAAVAGIVAFAWRRGRMVLSLVTLVALAIAINNLGPDFVRDPWNPTITVIPLALLVVLVWSAVEGDTVALPIAALVGSFLVQAHVGYAVLVAVLGVWAVVGCALAHRRQPFAWRRSAVVAAVVLGLCWMPVLIDQVVGTGNLTDLVSYFTTSDETPAGLGESLGVMARQLGGEAPWMGGVEDARPEGGTLETETAAALVVPFVVFGASGALAWWRARSAFRFQLTVVLSAAAGFLAVSRITGGVFDYLVRWWWMIALLWWVSVFWSLWSAVMSLPAPRPRWVEPVVAALALFGVVWYTAPTVQAVDESVVPDGDWRAAAQPLVEPIIEAVGDDQPVLVRGTGMRHGWLPDTVRLQLVREGVDVLVDDEHAHKYGESRRGSTNDPVSVVWLVGPVAAPEVDGRGDLELITTYTPLSPAEQAELDDKAARLVSQLDAAGETDLVRAVREYDSLYLARQVDGVDQALLARVDELQRRGEPVNVYLERLDGST